nr:Arm DNA-binding domain-containing protein [Laribacter hongkongensis]
MTCHDAYQHTSVSVGSFAGISTMCKPTYQHGATNMPLTDTACRNAKPADGDKPIKLSDGLGLHLLIKTTGKYWRLAYRFGGKQKTLALGVYPAVSLKDARERRDEARKLLAADIALAKPERHRRQPAASMQPTRLRSSPVSGMENFCRPGQRATLTRSCAALSGMFSRGWAAVQLPRSMLLHYWSCCGGSRAGARQKRPTVP